MYISRPCALGRKQSNEGLGVCSPTTSSWETCGCMLECGALASPPPSRSFSSYSSSCFILWERRVRAGLRELVFASEASVKNLKMDGKLFQEVSSWRSVPAKHTDSVTRWPLSVPRHRPPAFRPGSPSPALGARVPRDPAPAPPPARVRRPLGAAPPGHTCARGFTLPPRPRAVYVRSLRISARGPWARPRPPQPPARGPFPPLRGRTRLGHPPRSARGAARRPQGLSPSGPIEALEGKGHSLSRFETTHFPRLRARARGLVSPARGIRHLHPSRSTHVSPLLKRIKQIGFFLPLSKAVPLDIICLSEVTATKLHGMLQEGSDFFLKDCA